MVTFYSVSNQLNFKFLLINLKNYLQEESEPEDFVPMKNTRLKYPSKKYQLTNTNENVTLIIETTTLINKINPEIKNEENVDSNSIQISRVKRSLNPENNSSLSNEFQEEEKPINTLEHTTIETPSTSSISISTTQYPIARNVSTEDITYENKWVWFKLLFIGDCENLINVSMMKLIDEFSESIFMLLKYKKNHIYVHSLECFNKLLINISVDSNIYPKCEEDMQSLLYRNNIRVRLHNSSFYLQDMESKKSSIFSTKTEIVEYSPSALIFTFGAVGFALTFIVFAGFVYIILQCIRERRDRLYKKHTRYYLTEDSPRFMRSITEEPSRLPTTVPYRVNIYKSLKDLSSPSLYNKEASTSNTMPFSNQSLSRFKANSNEDISSTKPPQITPAVPLEDPVEPSSFSGRRFSKFANPKGVRGIGASTESLGLTRIAFLGNGNPSFRIETDL